MSDTEKIFQSISRRGFFSLAEVFREILGYIGEKPDCRYEIVIGSDSAGFADKPVSIVTALAIRRVGNGGRYFYLRNVPRRFHITRDRIYAETMSSITLAQEVRGKLREALGDHIFWEDQIHIDVGERGLTKHFIDEMVGMVRGFDFVPVIKPSAYAASSVADRHT